MPRLLKYDGTKDATDILERVMCRIRWAVKDRDALARKLEQIVHREYKGTKK